MTVLELIWIVLGVRAPDHCTEGQLGALPSSSAPPHFHGEVQGLGFRLVGPHGVWHFQMYSTSAGVSGERVLPLQSQLAEHWQDIGPDPATFLLCWAAKR